MQMELWFHKLSSWLRLLLHRREADLALEEEIQFHLEAKTEENVAKGMAPEAARRAARIELGGVEQVKEQVRAARTGAWLEAFVQDLRFGLRILRKSPGFTMVVVLILALGIGANTAVFSIINGLMLRSLPVRDPGQLVELLHQYPGEPAFNGFSWDAYRILRANHVFSDLIVGSLNFFIVRADKLQPQTVFGGGVGENFFPALGVRAAAGRLIGSEDVHTRYHAPVAVVSWSFWKSRFDMDPGIIGKKIVVDDAPVTIIGVSQRGFYGLSEEARQDIWLPVSLGPAPGWGFGLLGRLKPGVSLEQARAEMAVLFQTVVNAPDAGPFVKKNETSNRARRTWSLHAAAPGHLHAADCSDGHGRPSASTHLREPGRIAFGPRGVAPARNGSAGLPGGGARSADPADAHGIFVALSAWRRSGHFPGLFRSPRIDTHFRIRTAGRRPSGSF